MTRPQPAPQRPPGWYLDNLGVIRFWDGKAWTEHTAPPPPPTAATPAAPARAGTSPYTAPSPIYVQPNVRQSRDRAQYSRPQTGHSQLKQLILGIFVLYIPTIYYAASPNHYFHL